MKMYNVCRTVILTHMCIALLRVYTDLQIFLTMCCFLETYRLIYGIFSRCCVYIVHYVHTPQHSQLMTTERYSLLHIVVSSSLLLLLLLEPT